MQNKLVDTAIQHSVDVIDHSLMCSDEATFILKLEAYVLDLLQHDFNALVNLLYRIDVPEKTSKACFGQENHLIAKCLAELIWQRQLQKAQTRLSFK